MYSWQKRGYKIATLTESSLTLTEPRKKLPRTERVLSRHDEERYEPHRYPICSISIRKSIKHHVVSTVMLFGYSIKQSKIT